MSTTTDTSDALEPPAALPMSASRRGRWIERWDPDDEAFWEASGRRIAKKNLVFSIFAENLGFSVWVLWTIVVLNLANIGIALSISELFILVAVPNLVGSFLRIPYTFAVPRFGGRLWTTISASLLLIPTSLLAFLVPSGWLAAQSHGTQLWVLIACAAAAGVGGGNFSSSMANISFFYPEKHKGFALGLNAAGGNLGVAVAQLLVPLVIIVGVPAARREAARPRREHGLRRPRVDAVHRRRRAVRVVLHGQPARGEVRQDVLRPGAQAPADVDHVVSVHRHVRVLHRLLVRAAAGDQEHVPGVPRRSTRSSRPTSPGWASSAR